MGEGKDGTEGDRLALRREGLARRRKLFEKRR
jgi:hypothetical protein